MAGVSGVCGALEIYLDMYHMLMYSNLNQFQCLRKDNKISGHKIDVQGGKFEFVPRNVFSNGEKFMDLNLTYLG